ncbi:hypothetical protein DLK05_11330 [Ancylomarina longa]|uniref:Uncharacterized protein n=1 Tax=Ancylomarina longa TaxID=2487017 RepID=A0A434ATV7_9BACT|nr:hypothetical protein DLK05_11330 [Ancylomarina longa]
MKLYNGAVKIYNGEEIFYNRPVPSLIPIWILLLRSILFLKPILRFLFPDRMKHASLLRS